MLKNERLKNRVVYTEFGALKFDKKGKNSDLPKSKEKILSKLPGYEYEETVTSTKLSKEPKNKEPEKEVKPKPVRKTHKDTTKTKETGSDNKKETK